MTTLPLVDLAEKNDWVITHHRLYDLDPVDIPKKNVDPDYAWLFVFLQDLLQVENKDRGLLIDVGWYPEGDPAGSYELVELQWKDGEYDWLNPIIKVQTTKLDTLLANIQQLLDA